MWYLLLFWDSICISALSEAAASERLNTIVTDIHSWLEGCRLARYAHMRVLACLSCTSHFPHATSQSSSNIVWWLFDKRKFVRQESVLTKTRRSTQPCCCQITLRAGLIWLASVNVRRFSSGPVLISLISDSICLQCVTFPACVRQFLLCKNKFKSDSVLSCDCSASSRRTACTIRTKTRWRCARLCARCTRTARLSRQGLKLVSLRLGTVTKSVIIWEIYLRDESKWLSLIFQSWLVNTALFFCSVLWFLAAH